MSSAGTPPGWYPAPGDPPGTHRYWSGSEWTTGPTPINQSMPTVAGGGGSYMVHGKMLADPWPRIGARLIDAVIGIFVFGFILIAIFAGDDDFNQFTGFNFGYFLGIIVLGIAYEVGFVIWKGGTPGKLILGLRVVEAETGVTPPSPQHAVLRWVPSLVGNIPIIGGLLSLVIAILSLVWLFNDPKRQTVYDKVAKTYVVKI